MFHAKHNVEGPDSTFFIGEEQGCPEENPCGSGVSFLGHDIPF
jgi:hypothetical protein